MKRPVRTIALLLTLLLCYAACGQTPADSPEAAEPDAQEEPESALPQASESQGPAWSRMPAQRWSPALWPAC